MNRSPIGMMNIKPLSSPTATISTSIVDLGYAQYQGSVDTATNITSFLGIRYAAPPIGDLRWAAPQPPPTVYGVQQATTQPNECNQAPAGNSLTNPFESTSMKKRAVSQSEDCLFLNVYTPGSEVVATPAGGLPVVVWIHGGGYIQGSANLYNGADLIIDSNYGVITVVIQYRLGLFGFLSGEAVKEGGTSNAGLLDQNYALQWVQAHISSFGGDPTKVTIWGQSAGGGSVLQHLVAHGGNTQPPLFKFAMTSSMMLPSQYNYNDPIPEVIPAIPYLILATCSCSSSSDTLSCLRTADVNTLQTLNYNINLKGFFGTPVFVPVRPTVTIRKGRLNGNHLFSVTNSHEGNIFVNQSTTLDVADYVKALFPNFGSAQIAGVVKMYQNHGSNVDQANLVMGECTCYYLLSGLGERAWKFITAFSNSFMAMAMYTPGDITPSWSSWRHNSTEMMFNETSTGVPDIYTFKTDSAFLEPTISTSIVDLGYAQYQGSVDTATNITSFLGIRYAAPPIVSTTRTGNLRWAAPQPPPTVSGVQQATMQPNECNQARPGNSQTNPLESTSMKKRAISQSEDCLFLNVYTPGSEVVATPAGGLPVVVWIHGGGYILGSANLYNGADLIIDSNHGVITVVIQYRLGLFGFLSGEAVKEGGALNAGLLDQNYALQWVQSYIRNFGGDPTKVTIWGESAGGGSVLQHLVAHGGNTQPPLFRSAMTSSAFLPSQYNYNDRIPEMLYSEVVNGTNCSSSSDTLSCLRAADVNTLQTLNYNININGFYGTFVFIPVVDGTFILERPTVTIRKGRLNSATILVNQSTTLDVADYVKALFPNFGSAQVAGAVTMYQNHGSNVDQANLVMGECTCGEFAIPPALHISDIPYYFISYPIPYNNSQFITAFSNSFMAMAMFGTPDHRYTPGDITPSWSSWLHNSTEMMFNETSTGVPDVYAFKTDSALLERCAYWQDVSAYSAQ
ncbi:Alpha/Beta hydrolase protein [Suillus occidentalis]|nr:Alpha/Beta hydrolase protein [Suillus occidentalis]